MDRHYLKRLQFPAAHHNYKLGVEEIALKQAASDLTGNDDAFYLTISPKGLSEIVNQLEIIMSLLKATKDESNGEKHRHTITFTR